MMMTSIHPQHLSAPERLEEVAAVLAAGLGRLLLRQSTPLSRFREESSVDCPASQSGHANILTDGGLE
jgi:hypothetical protein